ncbi:MAG: peptidoglycan-binding protein LysM [Pseudomonadales bacterium]
MGLFDFVKEAGEKMFGDDDGAKATDSVEVSQERINELRGQSIAKSISAAGVQVDGLQVAVAGDMASLNGNVASQEDAEKATLCAGNQHGISQVDCQLAVEKPEPEATFYTVQAGDSLSKIAKAQLGDAMQYTKIFEANKPMLTDPDKIYPGQVLRIPVA